MQYEINLSELNLQGISSIHIDGNMMTVTGYKDGGVVAKFTIPIEKDNQYFKVIK